MTHRLTILGCLAAALAAAQLSSGAHAQSYMARPTTDDFVRTLGGAPTNEEGLRLKGATRGLTMHVAPAPAPSVTRPSQEARPSSVRPSQEAAASQPRSPSLNFPVKFEFGSAELSAQSRAVLDELGAALSSSELRPYRFRVVGHTDAVGSDEYNLELSKRRAVAVEQYLQEKFGIEPGRVRPVGLGKSQPYNAQNPFDGINRRVEIIREARNDG